MPAAQNNLLPGATNDTWRTWLMTGVRRTPVDRRRMRGAHRGLKKMLLEGMNNGDDRPHSWKDFSGAMIRHAVDEAIRSLPREDTEVVKLAYFGGYSNREIASEVGLTEATVQRRLRRALGAISEHVQHGRAIGRRAMSVLAVWLSGRWLTDSAHHVVQVAVVAGAVAVIVVQPAPPVAPSAPGVHRVQSGTGPGASVAPPMPSPSIPAATQVGPPQVEVPKVQVPDGQLPVNPPVNLPVNPPVNPPVNLPSVPALPVKTPGV
ncbi:MAG: sigma-70 family RNA polymerase sigma factor [Chloroflexi bacterium]|nr:MAG: sigma-70 family RNA polymerase sigma factor [Chloroflexota bacterium]